MNQGKALIFSAPSGAGKTTIVQHLVKRFPILDFSISATTRNKRSNETDGVDYYFLSADAFKRKIDQGEFLEWEEVYSGIFYGTLKSELHRIWHLGKQVIFDVDVEGGINLKSYLGQQARSVFVKVNDVETLRRRLERRKSESEQTLNQRVSKAQYEMQFEDKFDCVIINDQIDSALQEAEQLTSSFLEK